MAFRQPFRSGLKDLAQGLMQQVQLQQQQSQVELQASQQASAQQAQAEMQAGQMMGQGIGDAVGMIGRGIEERRAEEVKFSHQTLDEARKDLDRLIAQRAQLSANHQRLLIGGGTGIDDFEKIDNGLGGFIEQLTAAISGDVADIHRNVSQLSNIEVFTGIIGGDARTAADVALLSSNRAIGNLDRSAEQLNNSIESSLALINNINPSDTGSVVRGMMAADSIIALVNSGKLPDSVDRAALSLQVSVAVAAFERNEDAQRMYGQAQALQTNIFNSQQRAEQTAALGSYETWMRTGGVLPVDEEIVRDMYARSSQGVTVNGERLSFEDATIYYQNRSENIVAGQQTLLELGNTFGKVDLENAIRWREVSGQIKNQQELQNLVASLVAAGDTSALFALSINSEIVRAFPEYDFSSAIASVRSVEQISFISSELAYKELQDAYDNYETEAYADRLARGSAALMQQASVLGEEGLNTWWNTLTSEKKQFYGGDAMFNAAVNQAKFTDLQRGNDFINVALARLAPILNAPGTPADMEAATKLIIETVTDITGDSDYAMAIGQSARTAWASNDNVTIGNQLKNIRLGLENEILRGDVAKAEACIRAGGSCGVDIDGLRQLLDSQRLNASAEVSAVMDGLRANDCILSYVTDEYGIVTQRGGANARSSECVNLQNELTFTRERFLEIEENLGSLFNTARGVPQNQRPTTLDGASKGYLVNIGASTFGSDYVNTGQIPPTEEVRAFVREMLSEGFNLGDGLNGSVDAVTTQILVSILNGNYVDVSEIQFIQSDPVFIPDNGVRLPYEVNPTAQVPITMTPAPNINPTDASWQPNINPTDASWQTEPQYGPQQLTGVYSGGSRIPSTQEDLMRQQNLFDRLVGSN